ncbi:MAG: hypothetical protein HOP32_15685 [Nitrospira sp.]|nr:hypothetical protein [Nitrospira sp.]
MYYVLLIRRAPLRVLLALAMMIASLLGLGARLNAEAGQSLPSSSPNFPSIIQTHSEQLAKVESDKEASNLFVSAIGPLLQLGDATRTMGGNPLPPKLANELLVADLTEAVHRLIGGLAAGRLASTIRQAIKDQQFSIVSELLLGSSPHRAWLNHQSTASWYDSLKRLADLAASPEWAKGEQEEAATALLLTALDKSSRLEVDALQAIYQEWDRIRNWKDRVRGLRGQARLCGTWQWIVHNHQQNHREQKLILVFQPAGNTQASPPGLAETIVLGENVYLRWEFEGRVQEDSLQFNKEGQRLEGTFVNSQGGWGSVSGKRTAGCAP